MGLGNCHCVTGLLRFSTDHPADVMERKCVPKAAILSPLVLICAWERAQLWYRMQKKEVILWWLSYSINVHLELMNINAVLTLLWVKVFVLGCDQVFGGVCKTTMLWCHARLNELRRHLVATFVLLPLRRHDIKLRSNLCVNQGKWTLRCHPAKEEWYIQWREYRKLWHSDF